MSDTNAGFPNISLPVVGADGRMSPQWFAFFVALFNRTGGAGSPIDINTLQKQDEISQEVPPQNPATQDALRGVAELWSEQRPDPSLHALNRRLDQLEAFLLDQQPQTGGSVSAPLMDGAAAIGSSSRYARADHIHPSDTTRAALSGAAYTGNVSAPEFFTATASVSGASAVAVTVYTMPATPAVFLVSCNIGAVGDTTNYSAFAIVVSDGSSARLAVSNNGARQTITLSGLAVQSTQSSGATQTINATITRIG